MKRVSRRTANLFKGNSEGIETRPLPRLGSRAVTFDTSVRCGCCGTPLPDTDQLDVRFGLPDVAFTAPETTRHQVNAGLLRVEGHGCFARCLLPVQLSGELKLILGTWMRISEADLERARVLWDEPGYSNLTLTGTLANAIKPWGEDLLNADLTAVVRDPDQIPYVATTHDDLLSRVLHTVWDRDQVLRCFGHPLPVRVQTPLDERWSIERTAGMAARVVDGTSQFVGPGRTVYADLFTTARPRTPTEWLASLTEGAPSAEEAHQITEEYAGGLRRAFWRAATVDGRKQHELYGFVIRDDQALAIACMYDDPDDLAWAQHVWRSVVSAD
ncbi:DUF2199 domain-containing protein [Nonomuraea polychroma]|uniref:DUF2199 domain-containing protein n=1 Tax=Nonomuraea polychroma TaxID=46176 RepID=UPI003D929DB5